MQNRFGLKDFIVILGLLAIGVSVWLTWGQFASAFNAACSGSALNAFLASSE